MCRHGTSPIGPSRRFAAMQHFGRFRPITEIQTDPLPALDSRSTFRLRVDSTVVGENLTAAQAQLLVADILERIALPNRDRIGREIGAAEGELEPRGGQMFGIATMTAAWWVRLAAMSTTLRQSARSQFLKPMRPEW